MPRLLLNIGRYVWASPNTLLGLCFWLPTICSKGSAHWVTGVLEIHGGITSWFLTKIAGIWLAGGASAMTLGHVVLGQDAGTLARTRRHERVHVEQYERWGPLFLPAYLGASLYLKIRGREAYFGNPFEMQAYSIDDGASSAVD